MLLLLLVCLRVLCIGVVRIVLIGLLWFIFSSWFRLVVVRLGCVVLWISMKLLVCMLLGSVCRLVSIELVWVVLFM